MNFLITTSDTIPGYEIVEVYGLVMGNTVRARHIGRDILASFKSMVGGEIKGYTDLLSASRNEALERMIQDAQMKGANAVVAVRFETSDVMQTVAELFAYGTAVKIKKL